MPAQRAGRDQADLARQGRRLARTALAFALAAVALLVAATSLGNFVAAVAIAIAALALAAIGGWLALSHHGVAQAAGVLVAVGALAGMVLLYAGSTTRWLVALGAAAV